MRPRWLIVGLVASLALNLFLLGAAAGVVALGARMAHDGANPRFSAFLRATGELPQPARNALRASLRDAWRQVRPAALQGRQLRLEAWSAIADPRPDPLAIKQKLAQSRQLDASARTAVEGELVDSVLALPSADRAAFAASMRGALTPPGAAPAGLAPAKP